MNELKKLEVWFVTGSQSLYGEQTLAQVAAHSQEIAGALGNSLEIPVSIVYKSVMKSAEEITAMCSAANEDRKCIGIITWMHTFSPAKMWITGLRILRKPLLHL